MDDYQRGYAQAMQDAAATLPGTHYMDPPDGGSVTVIEQLQRMAIDASAWRAFVARIDGQGAFVARIDGQGVGKN